MNEKNCPYTEDMIKSENLLLSQMDYFKRNPIVIKPPKEKRRLGSYEPLGYGANIGEEVPVELKRRLERPIKQEILALDLKNIDYQADVVIVGTGGAGLSAAIEAAENGANVIVITKEKFGRSNTVLAQGGIQAATEDDDSPEQHFEDTFNGGHHKGKKELIKKLTDEAPEALSWLKSLGVEFKEEPIIPGGSSKKRLHTIGDKTGAEIMKALTLKVKALVTSKKIEIIRHADAQELLMDENSGAVAGIVFLNENRYKIVKAKSVILATGGSGSLKYNNMLTSNCMGSTADGLAIAYHAGAKLIDPGAIQYHPTGGAFPTSCAGKLISEKARSLGALLGNANGEALYSKGTRDDIVNVILEEEAKGHAVTTPDGNRGMWLITPLIDKIHGDGTIKQALPGLCRIYQAQGIDVSKHAILVYPTIHYHLGGIEIDTKGMTSIPNLFAVGEVSGGIDGDNRLMGNALASVVVYGRTAGREAAEIAKEKKFVEKLSLKHLTANKLQLNLEQTRGRRIIKF